MLLDDPKTRQLRLEPAHWSLVPPWSDSLKVRFPTFNARTEGITSKRTWAKPVKTSRAVIPASGYYEWTGERGAKQPWWIHAPGDAMIGFAGLYSWWQDRGVAEEDPARWTLTMTILTSEAVPHLAQIHDRNPVLLPENMWEHWIDPTVVGDQDLVDEAVQAGNAESERLEFHEVAPFGTRDDGAELLNPL